MPIRRELKSGTFSHDIDMVPKLDDDNLQVFRNNFIVHEIFIGNAIQFNGGSYSSLEFMRGKEMQLAMTHLLF